jgi:hypothetical protein
MDLLRSSKDTANTGAGVRRPPDFPREAARQPVRDRLNIFTSVRSNGGSWIRQLSAAESLLVGQFGLDLSRYPDGPVLLVLLPVRMMALA